MTKWKKEDLVELNKLICRVSGQPHAVRDEGVLDMLEDSDTWKLAGPSKVIAERHPFVESNKRTACCVAICEALEGV